MTRHPRTAAWFAIAASILGSRGCQPSVREVPSSGDAGTDTDADADTDVDTDVDTDTDADGGTECLGEEDCTVPCIRYVNGMAASSGDGLSWDTAMRTIQEALSAASCAVTECGPVTSCQVWVAEGNYFAWVSGAEDSFEIPSEVTLYGGFAGTETSLDQRDIEAHETVLDGHSPDDPSMLDRVLHVVTTSGVNTSMDGVTITGGLAISDADEESVGGGILARSCSFSLSNSKVIDNEAGVATDYIYSNHRYCGGGLSKQNGGPSCFADTLTVTSCLFEDNRAGTGGALACDQVDEVEIADTVFRDNVAYYSGGALWSGDNESLSIARCRFEANQANQVIYPNQWFAGGGAIVLTTFPPTSLTDSAFVGNSAELGGGLFIILMGEPSDSDTPLAVENLVFDGNTASVGGGAVATGAYTWGYTESIGFSNCTFFGNSAPEGSALYLAKGISDDATLQTDLWNDVFWGNDGTLFDAWGPVVGWNNDVPPEYALSHCLVEGGAPGEAILDQDPLFVSESTGDLHLQAGSPCIDAADDSHAPATDIDGNARYDDPTAPDTDGGVEDGGVGIADIGAYEYAP
jgi:predicted outer membrane repeat protein